MALSNYTGGGLFNSTSYTPTMPISSTAPPMPTSSNYRRSLATLPPQTLDDEEEKYQRRMDLLKDREGVKRRRKDHSVKRRELEEGAEQSSQLPEQQVAAQCGDDATLPCRAPRPDSVDGLEWTRTDLDQYVYLYKDGEPDPTEQHQAYRGRCNLMDGTATLVLENVTSADAGTYECRFVKHGLSKRSIISGDPVSVVRLRVTQSGACTGAEGEEDDKEDKAEEEDKKIYLPVKPERHHYVTFGVLGAFGLVAALIVFIALQMC